MFVLEIFQNSHIRTRSKTSKPGRLKSRKIIEQLFRTGKSFVVFPFRIYYMLVEEQESPLAAGFGVSARHFKKAVHRNRVKRVTREAFRLRKAEFNDSIQQMKGQLAVFFIYTGKDLPDFKLVHEKMGIILKRLIGLNS